MFQNNLLMGAASISAGGITVDNSVLYNDDDSPRLTRTPTTVGNRRTSSLSLWYKRCTLGSIQQLFNTGAGDDITFNANDKLTFADSSGVSYNLQTDRTVQSLTTEELLAAGSLNQDSADSSIGSPCPLVAKESEAIKVQAENGGDLHVILSVLEIS